MTFSTFQQERISGIVAASSKNLTFINLYFVQTIPGLNPCGDVQCFLLFFLSFIPNWTL